MQDFKSQKNGFLSVFNVLADVRVYCFFALALFLGFFVIFFISLFLLLSYSFNFGYVPVFVGMVALALVPFYGVCALGILILENHCNGNNISIKAAIVKALKIGHRFILVNILLFLALVLVFTLLYALVTLVQIPYLGQLYTLFADWLKVIIILAIMFFWVSIQLLLLGFTWQGFTLKQSFTAVVNVYRQNGSKLFIYSMLIFVVVLPIVAFLIYFFVRLTDWISPLILDPLRYIGSYMFPEASNVDLAITGHLLGLGSYLTLLCFILSILTVRLILYIYQLVIQDVDLTSTLSLSRQIPNSGINKTKQVTTQISKESNKQEKVNQEQLKISNNVKQTGENKSQE